MYRRWYTALMRHFRAKEILTIITILILAIIIGIVISSEHLKDYPIPQKQIATNAPALTIKLGSFSHSYRRGKYTLSGAIVVPTPCYSASATASIVSSTTPAIIRLDVTVPTDTGRCLQLSATTTFSVTQRATKNATVKVYINGTFATSTTS